MMNYGALLFFVRLPIDKLTIRKTAAKNDTFFAAAGYNTIISLQPFLKILLIYTDDTGMLPPAHGIPVRQD